jgi:hypothetical protein
MSISREFKEMIVNACDSSFTEDELIVITGSWLEAAESGVIDIDMYNANDVEIRVAASTILMSISA